MKKIDDFFSLNYTLMRSNNTIRTKRSIYYIYLLEIAMNDMHTLLLPLLSCSTEQEIRKKKEPHRYTLSIPRSHDIFINVVWQM